MTIQTSVKVYALVTKETSVHVGPDESAQFSALRESREYCQGIKLKSDNAFLIDEGRDDPNTTKSRSASACKRYFMAQHLMLTW